MASNSSGRGETDRKRSKVQLIEAFEKSRKYLMIFGKTIYDRYGGHDGE